MPSAHEEGVPSQTRRRKRSASRDRKLKPTAQEKINAVTSKSSKDTTQPRNAESSKSDATFTDTDIGPGIASTKRRSPIKFMCCSFLLCVLGFLNILVALLLVEEPVVNWLGDIPNRGSNVIGIKTFSDLQVNELISSNTTQVPSEIQYKEYYTTNDNYFGSGAMFNSIAAVYDIGNKLMSIGRDKVWRTYMVNKLLDAIPITEKSNQVKVLDLATGTADVAIAVVQAGLGKKNVYVRGVDPSTEMLRVGREKVKNLGLEKQISLEEGDAQDLLQKEKVLASVPSNSIDAVTMSFGIRNVPDRLAALKEMKRSLKPSGKLYILEFNIPEGDNILAKITESFIDQGIPFLGKCAQAIGKAKKATIGIGRQILEFFLERYEIEGVDLDSLGLGLEKDENTDGKTNDHTKENDMNEYDYFQNSIRGFPTWRNFSKLLNVAGFKVDSVTHFAFGAVQLYEGTAAV